MHLTPWEWVFYTSLPCLLLNIFGVLFALFLIRNRKAATFCFWLNMGALVWTVCSLIMHEYGAGAL